MHRPEPQKTCIQSCAVPSSAHSSYKCVQYFELCSCHQPDASNFQQLHTQQLGTLTKQFENLVNRFFKAPNMHLYVYSANNDTAHDFIRGLQFRVVHRCTQLCDVLMFEGVVEINYVVRVRASGGDLTYCRRRLVGVGIGGGAVGVSTRRPDAAAAQSGGPAAGPGAGSCAEAARDGHANCSVYARYRHCNKWVACLVSMG